MNYRKKEVRKEEIEMMVERKKPSRTSAVVFFKKLNFTSVSFNNLG